MATIDNTADLWQGRPCEGVLHITVAEFADAVADWTIRGVRPLSPSTVGLVRDWDMALAFVTPPHVLAAIDPAAGSGSWLTANPPYGEPS